MFSFSDAHITDYYHHGYTVFRGILPARLVDDLRAAGEDLHEVSRRLRGPDVARSPSIGDVAPELSPPSLKAFQNYAELPELVQAIQRVLSHEHTMEYERVAVFFAYPRHPTAQDWHRDIDEGYKGITSEADIAEFRRLKLEPTFHVQVNCALYTDSCLWYVLGSAGRPNTAAELAAAGIPYNGVPGRGRLLDDDLVGKSYAEQERLGLKYCMGMPNAINVFLEAGDFCMYRPLGWHTGNYAPHRKRMTLHHHVGTPALRNWQAAWYERMRTAKE